MKPWLPAIAMLQLSASSAACVSFSRAVSEDSELVGGFRQEDTLVVMRDVFLIESQRDLRRGELALAPERAFPRCKGQRHETPESIEGFQDAPALIPVGIRGGEMAHIKVKGIVRAGTRVEVVDTVEDVSVNLWFGHNSVLAPRARILDGPYAGTVVDITDLSVGSPGPDEEPYVHHPDPRLLRAERGSGVGIDAEAVTDPRCG